MMLVLKLLCNQTAENMGHASSRQIGTLFDRIARHTQEGLDFVRRALVGVRRSRLSRSLLLGAGLPELAVDPLLGLVVGALKGVGGPVRGGALGGGFVRAGEDAAKGAADTLRVDLEADPDADHDQSDPKYLAHGSPL